MRTIKMLGAVALLALVSVSPSEGQAADMTFFLTSGGPGDGANLGGLAGADAHCQSLAAAVGAGSRTWRAYLSTTGTGGENARDRIGQGPWQNIAGDVVATNLDTLHYENNLTKETVLNEQGGSPQGSPNLLRRKPASIFRAGLFASFTTRTSTHVDADGHSLSSLNSEQDYSNFVSAFRHAFMS